MINGLTEQQNKLVNEIFARHPEIEQVILYGSRAMDKWRPSSDIDLTIKGENVTSKTITRLVGELDDLLLPFKFDISAYNQISNADLINHIQRVGMVIFRSEL